MSISKKDVAHMAHLARIELTPSEEEKFEKELSSILELVEKLNEVNAEHIAPLAGGTTLDNATRRDEQLDQDLENNQEGVLTQAPEKKDGWIKVKPIFP